MAGTDKINQFAEKAKYTSNSKDDTEEVAILEEVQPYVVSKPNQVKSKNLPHIKL